MCRLQTTVANTSGMQFFFPCARFMPFSPRNGTAKPLSSIPGIAAAGTRSRVALRWFVVIDKLHRLSFPARREQQLRLPSRQAPVFSAFLLQIQVPSAPFPGDCTTLQALHQLELRGGCSLSYPHLLRQKIIIVIIIKKDLCVSR